MRLFSPDHRDLTISFHFFVSPHVYFFVGSKVSVILGSSR